MAKSDKIYLCQKCGAEHLRWSGKCEACGEWDCLAVATKSIPATSRGSSGRVVKPMILAKASGFTDRRISTGINELDQVLGSGIVPGSVILLGGEPGIGKSTLLLQTGCSGQVPTTLYVSGEESAGQIEMRAQRLGVSIENLNFLSEMNIDNIVATIRDTKPALVIIDSIQTVLSNEISSVVGSVTQVREAAYKLIELAKSLNIPIIIAGHVTKEGNVAGPKTLEHLVDVVLYLEGDRYHSFRILRAVKNRFGSTNEVGVFEMRDQGLVEVKNPAGLFLVERQVEAPGSVVTATLEGNRSFLVEVQGLTDRTVFGYPKRTASGYDVNRLQLLLAVLTKRADLKLHDRDVYLNIVGGFKIKEPAVDLAVCLSVASSFLNKNLDSKMIVLGEVGLAGEVRAVSQVIKRINEAQKLGFTKVILPKVKDKPTCKNCEIIMVDTVKEAINKVF
ncbi:DNA repair protein RadA [Patescibacteria group bacterium]|nr:DNA repair protein RadA [Patescibacteria group bacterium]